MSVFGNHRTPIEVENTPEYQRRNADLICDIFRVRRSRTGASHDPLGGLRCTRRRDRAERAAWKVRARGEAPPPIPTWPAGASDHVRRWVRRDGPGVVWTSEPYNLGVEMIREILVFCDYFGLRARFFSSELSFHYPGGTFLIAVERLDQAPERAERLHPVDRRLDDITRELAVVRDELLILSWLEAALPLDEAEARAAEFEARWRELEAARREAEFLIGDLAEPAPREAAGR